MTQAMCSVPASTLNFFTNECEVVHALCDRSGVPRTTEDGEVFSMSQRVGILQGITEGLMKRIGQTPPYELH